MNVDTRTLARTDGLSDEERAELVKQGFEPVPEEFSEEAAKRLADRERVQLARGENTPLSRWATNKHQKNKRKRRQMAKASRRANRR